MANSHPKFIANQAFVVSSRREPDWTSMIILALGTALVAFLALVLSQHRPLIMAVERMLLSEFIVR